MVSAKIWVGINMALALIAIVLLLAFIGAKLPTAGKALYYLDPSTAYCVTEYQKSYALMDVDSCCSEMQQQLIRGEPTTQEIVIDNEPILVTKKYYTSQNTISYIVNQKAYLYCKNNGFMVD